MRSFTADAVLLVVQVYFFVVPVPFPRPFVVIKGAYRIQSVHNLDLTDKWASPSLLGYPVDACVG